ncbi:MAG TPA: tail fiber protein [Burkholderiales bacterium]|nr:tail fiber protein [Burkholderiales bacterium]
MFGGNFAPRNWAFCNGQLMSISQNTTLFALIGTTYGGDGQTTFALPDLRGRSPMHSGQGPGLSNRVIGESAGEESHTLLAGEMPTHGHVLYADASAPASTNAPAGDALGKAVSGATTPAVYATPSAFTAMASSAIGPAGGSQPHENRQPYLAVSFIICLFGIFPTRN